MLVPFLQGPRPAFQHEPSGLFPLLASPFCCFFFVIVLNLLLLVFWVWMIIDCASNEPAEGSDKIVWILVVLLAGPIGALIYLLARRPKRLEMYGR